MKQKLRQESMSKQKKRWEQERKNAKLTSWPKCEN